MSPSSNTDPIAASVTMADDLSPRKKRFAPVPIETTFRKGGPAAELTPEPSPISTSSPSPTILPVDTKKTSPQQEQADNKRHEKRRFAPQLVESSRRSRRIGDVGPATRPTDKTDITPYTKHIYAFKPKWKLRMEESFEPQSRRESCDEEVANIVFGLSAKEAEKQVPWQEQAMAAFPNSGVRTGGAEHFWAHDGSEDDDASPPRGRSAVRQEEEPRKSTRRDASEDDVGWAVKEMQEHHDRLSRSRAVERIATLERVSTLELDEMTLDGPPEDAAWITSRKSSETEIRPMGEQLMPFIPSGPLPTIAEKSVLTKTRAASPPPVRPIGETFMPYIPSAPAGKAGQMAYVPSSQIPAETGFGQSAYGYGYGNGYDNPEMAADLELQRLRHRVSPPMLGKDLVFRTCPSPQQTKLEPEHLWTAQNTDAEAHRDPTGENGLWNGYCWNPSAGVAVATFDRDKMLDTPFAPSTPHDPFAASFAAVHADPHHPYNSGPVHYVSDEPGYLDTSTMPSPVTNGSHTPEVAATPTTGVWTPQHRSRNSELKGLHLVLGPEDRFKFPQEVQANGGSKPIPIPIAQLDENIAAEFNDEFITQVYNYLSLGYPAMARFYDDELSKISRISITELEQDDEDIMAGIGKAKGHINIHAADTPELAMLRDKPKGLNEEAADQAEPHCPRWMALKTYIHEWARQHPDLNSISPLAWGVRERRGSWRV